MEAKEKALNEIFCTEPKKLVVPFFQRRYVWKQENWDELISTIEENDDVKVFLGSIIIKWGTKHEPSEATIVDGQQRLTTLSLLTKAIYDELNEKCRKNALQIVSGSLLYKESNLDDIRDSHVKIEHSRVDSNMYGYIIGAGLINDEPIEIEQMRSRCIGQIGACYLYYRELLNKKSEDEKKKILDTMYNPSNKMIVRIVLDSDDVNEQTIFDTINRAGVGLSTADIIKNNLFKGFLDACGNDNKKREEVNLIYDEKWDKLFYREEGPSEWDEERHFGNVKHNNLEFLLYCVACIKWAMPSSNEIFSKLVKVYEENTAGYSFEDYEQLLNEICDYAIIFKNYIIDFGAELTDKDRNANCYFKPDAYVKKTLFILEHFGIQMFYPYVLRELKKYECNLKNQDLIRKFKILESFVVRRRIKGGSVSDYTPKCYLILRDGVEKLFYASGDKEISISDGDIKNCLTNVKIDTAKVILFCIELARRTKNHDEDALTFTYTLEHIMPQKWKKNWPVEDDKVEERERHINDIGNMTLIKGTLNAVVQNSSFDIKISGKPAEGRKRAQEGYKGNISLSITSDIVDRYNEGDKVWDEDHIDERRQKLAEEIIELWPYVKSGS